MKANQPSSTRRRLALSLTRRRQQRRLNDPSPVAAPGVANIIPQVSPPPQVVQANFLQDMIVVEESSNESEEEQWDEITVPIPVTSATSAIPAIPATPATPASLATLATPATPATPATTAIPAIPATPATPAATAVPATSSKASSFTKDKETLFVLQSWLISATEDKINQMINEHDKHDFWGNIIATLFCNSTTIPVDDMISFLSSEPESRIGHFLVGILTVDYVSHLTIEELVEMYSKSAILDTSMFQLIEDMIIMKLQRAVRRDIPSTNVFSSLPSVLMKKVSLEFADVISKFPPNESKQGDDDVVVTVFETDRCFKIAGTLFQQIFKPLININKDEMLLDSSFTSEERKQTWGSFITFYMQEINKERRTNTLDLLFKYNQMNKIGTREFSILNYNGTIKSIHFHDYQLNLYCKKDWRISGFAECTPMDVESFIDILYCSAKTQDYYYGRVTPGLCNLVMCMQIRNPVWFLFRMQPFENFFQQEFRKLLLPCVLCLEDETLTTKLAAGFKDFYPGCQSLSVFNGLSSQKVINFFSHICLQIYDIEKYKILIEWSHHAARKQCNNPMTAPFDKDVNMYFESVKSLINVKNLIKYLEPISKQGYINLADFINNKGKR